MKKEYIKNIKNLRIEKGLSQKEMAESLGFGHSNYNKIENGIIELSVSKLYEIADILEVSILRILGGQEVEKLENEIRNEVEQKIQNDFKGFFDILSNMFKNPVVETPEKIAEKEENNKKRRLSRFERGV